MTCNINHGPVSPYKIISTLNIIVFSLSLYVVFAFTACATSGFLGFGDPLVTFCYVGSAIAEMLRQLVEALQTYLEMIESE